MSNTLKFGNGQWATKDGSVLAYNSENNNYKPLPFDFSRGSTATRINKEGLIETVGANEPRVDYKDDSKGAMLLEPTRTNYLLQSNQFNTTWSTSTAISISSGYSGVYSSNNAWLLKRVDGNSRYLYQNVSLSNTQTFSIYLKADTTNWAWLFLGGTTSWAYFDLENGEVGATNSLINSNIEHISDGWFKCTITANVTLSSVRVYPAQGNLAVSGDNNLGIYIQHAQLEQGSYSTSLIKTQGTAQTRLADECSQTLPSSVFNSYPFSVFAEVDVVDTSSGYAFSLLKSSSSAEYFTIEYFQNVWHITARPNGSTQRITSTTTVSKGTHKIVGVWESSSMKLYLNGSLIASGSNSQSFNSQVNSMLLGQLRISGDTGSRNSVREALLYNTELTDQEAIALTQV